MRSKVIITIVATGLLVDVSVAHEGPRVWIGNDNGRIRTYTSDNDIDPTVFTPSQVFEAPLEPFFGVMTTEFPGFEVRTDGGGVAGGTTFGFKLAGPLLVYDAASNRLRESAEFFSQPPARPAVQMAISQGSNVVVTNTGVTGGFTHFIFGSIGDHAHLAYTLFGDGVDPFSASPDGAYVVPFVLSSPSLEMSDWYFLVLGKQATAAQMDGAHDLAHEAAEALPGDANFSGTVDIDDFGTLASQFNTTGKWWANGDFNFDGAVNIDDFGLLASNFNLSSPAARGVAVPEPGALGVLLAAALLRRRR